MLHTFKQQGPQSHKCQIDCTNHDEVINKLEMKSKDLYYFWRNYEWLYNKYYNQPKKIDTSQAKQYQEQIKSQAEQIRSLKKTISNYQGQLQESQRKCRSFESKNSQLERDNQRLEARIKDLGEEVSGLLKQVKKSISPDLEDDYKREIKRLMAKIEGYKDNEDHLMRQNQELQRSLERMERDLEKSQSQRKAALAQLKKVSEDYDKLRLQIASQPNPSTLVSQRSAWVSQSQQVTLTYNRIKEQAQQILNSQMERTRSQLKQQLGRLVFTLSERELQSLLVQIN